MLKICLSFWVLKPKHQQQSRSNICAMFAYSATSNTLLLDARRVNGTTGQRLEDSTQRMYKSKWEREREIGKNNKCSLIEDEWYPVKVVSLIKTNTFYVHYFSKQTFNWEEITMLTSGPKCICVKGEFQVKNLELDSNEKKKIIVYTIEHSLDWKLLFDKTFGVAKKWRKVWKRRRTFERPTKWKREKDTEREEN